MSEGVEAAVARRPPVVDRDGGDVAAAACVVVVPAAPLSDCETLVRIVSRTLVAWAASLELSAVLAHITRALFKELTLRSWSRCLLVFVTYVSSYISVDGRIGLSAFEVLRSAHLLRLPTIKSKQRHMAASRKS